MHTLSGTFLSQPSWAHGSPPPSEQPRDPTRLEHSRRTLHEVADVAWK